MYIDLGQKLNVQVLGTVEKKPFTVIVSHVKIMYKFPRVKKSTRNLRAEKYPSCRQIKVFEENVHDEKISYTLY